MAAKFLPLMVLVGFLASPVTVWSASFQGEWTGTGEAWTLNGTTPCDHIEMRFLHTKDTFVIRGGGYICGEYQAQYPYSTFQLRDGEVFYEGQKVGDVSEDKLLIKWDNGAFRLQLQHTSSGLFFRELWSSRDDFLLIEGQLQMR